MTDKKIIQSLETSIADEAVAAFDEFGSDAKGMRNICLSRGLDNKGIDEMVAVANKINEDYPDIKDVPRERWLVYFKLVANLTGCHDADELATSLVDTIDCSAFFKGLKSKILPNHNVDTSLG